METEVKLEADTPPAVTAEATEVDNETMNKLNAAFLASAAAAVGAVGCLKPDVECADFNFQLIQEVKKRPCLYNMNDDTYNNNQMRAAMWGEIALKFNTSSEFVKTRWKTMRDRYKKEEKRWRGGKHTSWNFFPQLHFISPYLRARYPHDPDERAIECLPDEDAGSPIDRIHHITLDSLLSAELSSTTDPTEPPPAKKARENGSEQTQTVRQSPPPAPVNPGVIQRIMEPSVPSPLSINTASSPTGAAGQSTPISLGSAPQATLAPPSWSRLEDEEDEMFGHMIAMKLNKLHPKIKEKAKIRLMAALYEVQYGSEER